MSNANINDLKDVVLYMIDHGNPFGSAEQAKFVAREAETIRDRFMTGQRAVLDLISAIGDGGAPSNNCLADACWGIASLSDGAFAMEQLRREALRYADQGGQ